MIYIIGYDLNKPGQDYAELFEALKSFPSWWHYLDSTWLISTNNNATEIFNKLKPYIDTNDRILVIQANNDHAGWLSQKAWDWINEH